MTATRYISDIVVQKMSHADWSAWVKTLKTGDVVIVCYYAGGRAIYKATVRVTPTGKVFLEGRRDRLDWGKHQSTSTPGGGERFIAPLPDELADIGGTTNRP